MKYLGTNYLHNLQENNFLREFNSNGCICYILTPKNSDKHVIAIPKYYIYNYINSKQIPSLCDLFESDLLFPYVINDNNISFENETYVKEWCMSFAKGIYKIQRHTADATIANSTNIIDIIRSENNSNDSVNDNIIEISISSFYDNSSKKYVVKNEKGEELISFRNSYSQRHFFSLIKQHINLIINLIRCYNI